MSTLAGFIRIKWKLMRNCTYSCAYCPRPVEDENCIFVKDRLIAVAQKLLQSPRPAWFIHFDGGEPVLHPFLPDLLNYIFATRRPITIAVNTNGSADLATYQALLEAVPPQALELRLAVHPKIADMDRVLRLLTLVTSSSQALSIDLHLDGEAQSNVLEFAKVLASMRTKIPFSLNAVVFGTMVPCTGAQSICNALDKASAIGPSPLMPRLRPAAFPNTSLAHHNCLQRAFTADQHRENCHCCLGMDFVRVEPDGSWRGGLCSNAPWHRPLWQEGPERVEFAHIARCILPQCPIPVESRPVRFQHLADARWWLAELKKEFTPFALILPPVPEVACKEPSAQDMILFALCKFNQHNELAFDAASRLIDRMPEVECVYNKLSSLSGKNLFLHSIFDVYRRKNDFSTISMDNSHGQMHETSVEIEKFFSSHAAIHEIRTIADISEYKRSDFITSSKIDFYLYPTQVGLLDLPLRLIEQLPEFSFDMQMVDGRLCFTVVNNGAFVALSLPKQDMAASIIVQSRGNAEALRQTINSVLAICLDDAEIFVAVPVFTAALKQLRDYFLRYTSAKLRFLEAKKAFPGKALSHVRGACLFLMAEGEIMIPEFKNALKRIEAEGLDVLIGSEAALRPSGVFALETREYSGSFAEHIAAQFYHTGKTPPIIYGSKLVRHFQESFQISCCFPDLLYALRTICLERQLSIVFYDAPLKLTNSSRQLVAPPFLVFSQFVDLLGRELLDNEPDLRNAIETQILLRFWQDYREAWLAEIAEGSSGNKIYDYFDSESLRSLGFSRPFLDMLIREYAELLCLKTGSLPKAKAGMAPITAYSEAVAYRHAATPPRKRPIVSVILPNYNKFPWLENSLKSVLDQSFDDFEIIAVDDCSDDGSYELLCSYADANPRLRLYRMTGNCRQGICRNIGMTRARGQFIVFMDSDDRMESDFLVCGVTQMRESGADLGVFSWRSVTSDGEAIHVANYENEVKSGEEALDMYFADKIVGACWGKIYRTDYLAANNCLFAEGIYQQDHFFTYEALSHAKSVLFSDVLAYSIIHTPVSSVRGSRKTYLHLHSDCMLFGFLAQSTAKNKHRQLWLNSHARWNLENIFLPACQAFSHNGHLKIEPDDFQKLLGNNVFLFAMLKGFALFHRENPTLQPIGGGAQKLPLMPVNLCNQLPLLTIIVRPNAISEALVANVRAWLSLPLPGVEFLIMADEAKSALESLHSASCVSFRCLSASTNLATALAQAQGEFVCVSTGDFFSPAWFWGVSAALASLPDFDAAVGVDVRDQERALSPRQKGAEFISGAALRDLFHLEGRCVFRKVFLQQALQGVHSPGMLAVRALQSAPGVMCLPCDVQSYTLSNLQTLTVNDVLSIMDAVAASRSYELSFLRKLWRLHGKDVCKVINSCNASVCLKFWPQNRPLLDILLQDFAFRLSAHLQPISDGSEAKVRILYPQEEAELLPILTRHSQNTGEIHVEPDDAPLLSLLCLVVGSEPDFAAIQTFADDLDDRRLELIVIVDESNREACAHILATMNTNTRVMAYTSEKGMPEGRMLGLALNMARGRLASVVFSSSFLQPLIIEKVLADLEGMLSDIDGHISPLAQIMDSSTEPDLEGCIFQNDKDCNMIGQMACGQLLFMATVWTVMKNGKAYVLPCVRDRIATPRRYWPPEYLYASHLEHMRLARNHAAILAPQLKYAFMRGYVKTLLASSFLDDVLAYVYLRSNAGMAMPQELLELLESMPELLDAVVKAYATLKIKAGAEAIHA